MPDHFSFTKLVVTDLEASARFYKSVFGLQEQARVEADVSGRPIEEIMFGPTAPGGGSFVLFRFLDRAEPATEEVILGFVTEDLDALVARATDAGGNVTQPPREMPEHGVRVAFVTDVEGHLIEVVELLQKA